MDEALVTYLDKRFAAFDRRFTEFDERFSAFDRRFSEFDERFSAFDRRFSEFDERFSAFDRRFTEFDERFSELDSRFYELRGEMTTVREELIRHFDDKLSALDREHRVLIEDLGRQVRKVAESHGILLQVISDVKLAVRDDIHEVRMLLTLSQEENNRRLIALEQHVGLR